MKLLSKYFLLVLAVCCANLTFAQIHRSHGHQESSKPKTEKSSSGKQGNKKTKTSNKNKQQKHAESSYNTEQSSVDTDRFISKDLTFTVGGVSFKMVYVEGGTFTMGITEALDNDLFKIALPTHKVTLRDYYIGQYEVTQELWQAVMGNNPSHFKGDLQRPVERVTWDECQTFISKLNNLTGRYFALPTEAEWEFAARGGQKSLSYRYAGSNVLSFVAWNDSNSSNTTHRVGTLEPNELGLYDMSGNVMEWCYDRLSTYVEYPQNNPTGGISDGNRMVRGGCWRFPEEMCRVYMRLPLGPDNSIEFLGLRLVIR